MIFKELSPCLTKQQNKTLFNIFRKFGKIWGGNVVFSFH